MEIKTITGKRIAIKQGEKAIIELNNSLFNDEGQFLGSYSYPVKLALTGETLEAIDFAPELEKKIRKPLIPVIVYLGGQVFKNSVLSLAVDGSEVEGTLQIDLRIINEKLKSTKLNELPCEVLPLSTTESLLCNHMKVAAANTDWRIYPYTFFPIKNPLFVGEVTQVPASVARLSNAVVNEISFAGGNYSFLASTGGSAADVTDTDRNLKHKVAFFYLPYVIKQVCNYLGYQAKGDFLNHPDVERIVIENINEMQIGTNGQYGTAISCDDHLPEITLEDFFKSLISFFCIRITPVIGSSDLIFSWKKSAIEKSKYVDLRNYTYKILQQSYTEPKGFTITAEVEKLDNDVAENTDEVTFGNGSKKLSAKAGTIRMGKDFVFGNIAQFYELPVQQKAGNLWDSRSIGRRGNSVNKTGVKEFPLRFLFTTGATYFANGTFYPRGDNKGTEFSLLLNGANSLYNYAYKNWFEKTVDAKKIRISVLLPSIVINQLKDEETIILESHSGVSIYCLWEKLRFTEQSDNSMALVEADLLILDSVIKNASDSENGLFVRVKISGRLIRPSDEIAFLDIEVFSNRLCTLPANPVNLKIRLQEINTLLYYENFGLATQTVSRTVFPTNYKFIMTTPSIRMAGYSPDNSGRIILKSISTNSPTNRFDTSINFQFLQRLGYTILPTIEI